MISVVGGSGFVGTRLVTRLTKRGLPVRIVDKRTSAVFPDLTSHADVRDIASLRSALHGSSVIYNLAAEHRDDVRPASLYRDVNVSGARNVCDAASGFGIRTIVFTSSVAVYGFPSGQPDEDAPCRPFNEYGRTKLEAEAEYKRWAEAESGRRVIILRPTVVFGEGNRGNVYYLLRQIARGRFVMVGKGTNRKSLAYVENVAAFLEHCLDLPPAQGTLTVNYVDKPDYDMNGLVGQVLDLLGRPRRIAFRMPYSVAYALTKVIDAMAGMTGLTFPVSALRIRKFASNTVFSSSAIRHMTFEPPFSIAAGLERTVRHEFLDQVQAPVYETE